MSFHLWKSLSSLGYRRAIFILDECPGSNEIEQSYWLKSHKLDSHPLDERPRPKNDKSRLNLHGTILEGNSTGSDQKQRQKGKELKWKLVIQRTKMQEL
jgi:hypothetical protein